MYLDVILVGAIVVLLAQLREHRAASPVWTIATHVIGNIAPMLERRGYRVYLKTVSFGRKPNISYAFESDHGLWLELCVNRCGGHFHLSELGRDGDISTKLAYSFEVSGPWDELTERNLVKFEESFSKWKSNGYRREAWTADAHDLRTFYMPSQCVYVDECPDLSSMPIWAKTEMAKRLYKASPSERYPLVPLAPGL